MGKKKFVIFILFVFCVLFVPEISLAQSVKKVQVQRVARRVPGIKDTSGVIKDSLNSVVVTATESRGVTSSSKISRHAMEHLQPSSFSDLLELLPGGRAFDPILNEPNEIHLREVPISSTNYSTSSLGTSFILDGAPISTNANMQSMTGAWDSAVTSRDFTNQGVDMRSLSTDDIQSVEIVRGIPSVEYGDLTSGLVKIERKRGGNNLEARFKADMNSKLYYIGKGFDKRQKGLALNVSADYLDAKADPRNKLEIFTRITLSARANKIWNNERYKMNLAVNLDYGGSFDKDKVDPDINYGAVDKYKSGYNRYSASATFKLNPKCSNFFHLLEITTSSSLQHDYMERTRLVQLERDTPAAITTKRGESDAAILPYTYVASQSVDGQPFNLFARINADFSLPLKSLYNSFKMGADWNTDKNFGEGQKFDVTHPLYPGVSTRPRKFSSIPAGDILGIYAEENIHFKIGKCSLETVAGIRGNEMFNIATDYSIRGKMYFDPRANVKFKFPAFFIGSQSVTAEIGGGVGYHTKMPTISQLYPSLEYLDIVELNYYNNNASYKRVYLMTYVIDPVNKELKSARNFKWEIRGDLSIEGNRLSVDYFQENMESGFRSTVIYNSYEYKEYDASGVDASGLTGPPSLDDMPYKNTKDLKAYNTTTNGSRTFKRGIELVFSSVRIPSIRTRLTVTGAWFRTEYKNSQPVTWRPSEIVNGERIAFAGIYRDDDGYIREMANTNFTFDTDIPKLNLGFSLSAQCVWFTGSQSMKKEGVPIQYLDKEGNVHSFTESDKSDIYLRWLVREYSNSLFEYTTVPFCMSVNLKATKRIMRNHLTIALFVNKMLDCYPNYKRNGLTVRRHVTPYFGVEMNVKI